MNFGVVYKSGFCKLLGLIMVIWGLVLCWFMSCLVVDVSFVLIFFWEFVVD